MKRGNFSPAGQTTDSAPYRRGNFSCAYEWLEDFSGLDEILAHLSRLAASDPGHRYLCTLDNVSQCSYTCGHAGQDDRLYLDSPDDMDWDDPEQERAWEQASLQHRLAQLSNSEVAQSWEQVCGSLFTMADDVRALVLANREVDQLLDDVVYVQRIPVSGDDLMIAAQPNGYFSADWDTFQNHAIIRHLATQYGYRFFGMGAAWMGFVRSTPPSEDLAQRLIADLRELYGKGHDEVFNNPGWAEMTQLIQSKPVLMLGYIENMAESVDLPEQE